MYQHFFHSLRHWEDEGGTAAAGLSLRDEDWKNKRAKDGRKKCKRPIPSASLMLRRREKKKRKKGKLKALPPAHWWRSIAGGKGRKSLFWKLSNSGEKRRKKSR